MLEKCKKTTDFVQLLIWLFPVLFLIDNILGFNGYQFTIAGKSIRIILFVISVAVLSVYSVCVMIKDKISLFANKNCENTLWKLLRPIDYVVLFFIFGNFLWATVIPLFIRGEMIYSLKDFSTLLVLVLYFPLAFLIRTGRLKLYVLEKMIYVLTLVLAVWHCVMYVGDTLHEGFYASYYDFIDIISFGTAVRTDVVYGFGIVRVIQTTSIFLLLGVFLAIRYMLSGKWWHTVSLAVFTFAICATYTKSIWIGYFVGLVLYLGFYFVFKKEKTERIRSALALGLAIVLIAVLNYAPFSNTIFERMFNTISTNQSIEEIQLEIDKFEDQDDQDALDKLKNKLKDAMGTQYANSLRYEQNIALIEKWSESKLVGFGYGSYVEDCVRNEQFPYMYESAIPTLAMKIGLIGFVLWAIFIIGTTVAACRRLWKEERGKLFLWLGTAVSFAMAVQTNPFLFTFAGISMLLYLLIIIQKNKFAEDNV